MVVAQLPAGEEEIPVLVTKTVGVVVAVVVVAVGAITTSTAPVGINRQKRL